MSVVMPGDSLPAAGGVLGAPLAVAGTVHGRSVEALVTGLPEVLAQIASWTAADPDAIGCWGLRADYSEPLFIPVRPQADVVDRSRRVVHLVCLLPGEPHGGTLTVTCGESLSLVGVEAVEIGTGMPCERCLTRQVAREMTRDAGGLQRAINRRLDRQIG